MTEMNILNSRPVLIFLLSLLLLGCQEEGKEASVASQVTWLFVLNADSGVIEKNKLVFHVKKRELTYFSARPQRLAGRASLHLLKDIWENGADSFQKTPPNAALVIEGEREDNTIIVLLSHIEVNGQVVKFKYKTLKGKIPDSFGRSALLIDGKHLPLNPCLASPGKAQCD